MSAIHGFSELSHCAVCGARDVRVDYLDGAVPLELGECPRCSHRFTRSLSRPTRQPAAVGLVRDVRSLPHAA